MEDKSETLPQDDTTDASSDSDSSEGSEEVTDKNLPSEFDKLRKELAEMPFEELEKLKETVGMKMYNEAMFGSKAKGSKSSKKQFTRENKNRPQEVSSKRRPPKLKPVIQIKKKVNRDPRFDDLSGQYSEQHFSKEYSFLSDIKQREKHKLLKKFHKEEDEAKKKQIEQLIHKMDQDERQKRDKETHKSKKAVVKQQEKALVSDGKKPYFLKKSEQKKLELADKFRELKNKGKVDKYLNKKRKKTAAKDRKHLPQQQ